ncbi:MAG TPA: 6-phosphogluconolactonase, partial [Acidobacteriota bacterium]|nr:6-phosphogluconolactonase [Acidobacteriota bacterium]
MDRQISQSTKIKRTLWRSFSVILVLGVAMAALAYGPRLLKPTIGRADFRTARVEAGPIEATINSTGVVVPDFEQVISSPVNGRILRVLKRPGDPVRRGDAILELDVSEATLALEKLKQQIDLKQNQQAKARLDLQNTLNTLRSQWEIKNLDYEAAKASTGCNRKLKELGLLSAEQLHEAIARSRSASELLWEHVEWWWGDERFVPSGSEQRNDVMAQRSLFDRIQITPQKVHSMPASDDSFRTIQDAADSYTAQLTRQAPDGFDIVLLSLGPDDHIASLFPDSTSLSARQVKAIAITSAPKPPPERITLALEALAHTKNLWIMASGSEKAGAVKAAISDQATDLPAVRLS